jgi:hypothetical protein
MRLVVDANILVAELIRERGRKLIARPELELYMAEQAWSEATYELNKRIEKMIDRGVFSASVAHGVTTNEKRILGLGFRGWGLGKMSFGISQDSPLTWLPSSFYLH